MYWSLLPVAIVTFWLGLRTPSVTLMIVWLLLTFVLIVVWGWLHYRHLFPEQSGQLQFTPMDKQQLEVLRQQKQNTQVEQPPVSHGVTQTPTPIVAPQPAAIPTPTPAPTPVPTPAPVERPLTGRAVFIVPDDDLPPPPPRRETPPQ